MRKPNQTIAAAFFALVLSVACGAIPLDGKEHLTKSDRGWITTNNPLLQHSYGFSLSFSLNLESPRAGHILTISVDDKLMELSIGTDNTVSFGTLRGLLLPAEKTSHSLILSITRERCFLSDSTEVLLSGNCDLPLGFDLDFILFNSLEASSLSRYITNFYIFPEVVLKPSTENKGLAHHKSKYLLLFSSLPSN